MSSYKSDLISELNDLADAINLKADSSGAKSLSALTTTVRGIQKQKPEQTKNITLDFSSGDQTVQPSTGEVFSSVTITKPETLIPDNIAEGVTIAGIEGIFAGSNDIIELPAESGWYYCDGNSIENQKIFSCLPSSDPIRFYYDGNTYTVTLGEGSNLPSGEALPQGGPGWYYFDESGFSQGFLIFRDTDGHDLRSSVNGYFYVSSAGSSENDCNEILMDLPSSGDTDSFSYNGSNYTITCVDE